ncbi:hypothetical protein CPB84DRAFT_188053 [Gymnopilus junonius]|uniref:Uncharacterized protein n=1 Tax=Gymnopilus junonius TaxID=109634 RepID=A0A9P5NH85_GYMJU|nr:hypothetical protein CPB84DRAFT_188053 [Gymnopilus junonius]
MQQSGSVCWTEIHVAIADLRQFGEEKKEKDKDMVTLSPTRIRCYHHLNNATFVRGHENYLCVLTRMDSKLRYSVESYGQSRMEDSGASILRNIKIAPNRDVARDSSFHQLAFIHFQEGRTLEDSISILSLIRIRHLRFYSGIASFVRKFQELCPSVGYNDKDRLTLKSSLQSPSYTC